MSCGIEACATHKSCSDMSKECTIRLDSGLLIIDVNKIWFQTKLQMLYLYEAAHPFTRKHLMALNDIDSQEPDAYVRALKRHNPRQQFKPIEKRHDTTVYVSPQIAFRENWDKRMLQYQLTTEKAVVREQAMLLQEKDREIEELRRKLKTEISPYSNETQYGTTQRNSTTGDQRVGGKGADSS